MAGVPSSKGCRACKKQKKKCDQAQPSCSRCKRLGIACVDAGVQKYTFKPVTFRPCPSTSLTRTKRTHAKADDHIKSVIPRSCSADSTRLANELIAVLQLTDPRFNLRCYGDFLEDIPRRLGQNDALDASVKAMISAYPYHYTRNIPPEALTNYISALKALRNSLGGMNSTVAPETLSAIYIVMICQGWMGRSDDNVHSHGELLGQLANSALKLNMKGSFQLRFLETLFVPLLLEAMVNPAIKMEPWLLFIEHKMSNKFLESEQGIHISSLEPRKLIAMTHFFYTSGDHLDEIKSTYQDMVTDHSKLRLYLMECDLELNGALRTCYRPYGKKAKSFHRLQVVHAVLLTIAIALNSLLRTLYPQDLSLLEGAARITTDFITLATEAQKYRPLGASRIPPCLAAVWATTEALPAQRAKLQQLMTDYQPDFPEIRWIEQALWLQASHRALRRLLSGELKGDANGAFPEMLNISMVHCKAAFGANGSCLFV